MDKTPNNRLFVGSLPFKFTEGQLLSLFAPFGRIVALRIIHNQWGKSRGMGYVEYDNLNSAIDAKKKMHNFQLEERSIIVDYSQPDPFLTPEGQARHQEALSHKKIKRPFINPTALVSTKKEYRRPIELVDKDEKRDRKPKSYWQHQRPSVFDSRFHHARVGAKFAKRTKKK